MNSRLETPIVDTLTDQDKVSAVLKVEMFRTAVTGYDTSLLLIAKNTEGHSTAPLFKDWQAVIDKKCESLLRLIDWHGPVNSEIYAVILSSMQKREALRWAQRLEDSFSALTSDLRRNPTLKQAWKLVLLSHTRRDHKTTAEGLLLQGCQLLASMTSGITTPVKDDPGFQDLGVTAEEKKLLLGRN